MGAGPAWPDTTGSTCRCAVCAEENQTFGESEEHCGGGGGVIWGEGMGWSSWWLVFYIAKQMSISPSSCQDLVIITGRGKGSPSRFSPVVRPGM